MAVTPPEGFVLDAPPPPEGFVLDSPPPPAGFILDQAETEELSWADRVKSGLGSFAQGIAGTAAGMSDWVATASWELDKKFPDLDINLNKKHGRTERDDLGTARFAKWLRDKASELAPTDPQLQDSFWNSTVPQAAGSMVSFLGGGFAGKALTKTTFAAPALMGVMVQGAEGYSDAIEEGANENVALHSFLLNSGVGVSEVIPISRMVNRINKASGGGLTRAIKEAGIEGFQEFVQEFGQQTSANVIAKELYDKDRNIWDGVVEAGGAGGVTGTALSFIVSALPGKQRIKGVRGIAKEAKTEPSQLEGFMKSRGLSDLQAQVAKEGALMKGKELPPPIPESERLGLKRAEKSGAQEMLDMAQDKLTATLKRKQDNPKALRANNATAKIIKQQRAEVAKWEKRVESFKPNATPSRPGAFRQFGGKTIVPITDRLERFRPGLGSRLNQHGFDQGLNMVYGHNHARAFLTKYDKDFSKADKEAFDLAVFNQDTTSVSKIIKKYHITNETGEYKAIRGMLDNYFAQMTDLGLKVGYLKDHWPRRIKDRAGLMDYIHGLDAEVFGPIDRAMEAKAKELGFKSVEDLTIPQQAEVANLVIRGFGGNQINFGPTGNLKSRKFEKITKGMMKYYYPADQSLRQYIDNTSRLIADAKFFGGVNKEALNDFVADDSLDYTPDVTNPEWRDASIGAYIIDIHRQKAFPAWQQEEIQQMFKAYFNARHMPYGLRVAKEITQAVLLANPKAAITQLRDNAFVAYKNGGIETLQGLRYRNLTLEDLGIENIGQEFADFTFVTKYTNWFYAKSGFRYADRLGKEGFFESTFRNLQKRARAPKGSNTYNALLKDFKRALPNDAEAAIEAFASDNRMDYNVRFILFDRLSQFQPITRGQMPEAYLTHPVGRVAYTLQTFAIRQLNFVRNEIYDEIKHGDKKQGMRNLARFASWYMIMAGVGDAARDVISNRPFTPFSDAINAILELFGANRWAVSDAYSRGIGTALKQKFVEPAPLKIPFRILDDMQHDLRLLAKGELELKYAKTLRDFPVLGPLIDDWYGVHARKREESGE